MQQKQTSTLWFGFRNACMMVYCPIFAYRLSMYILVGAGLIHKITVTQRLEKQASQMWMSSICPSLITHRWQIIELETYSHSVAKRLVELGSFHVWLFWVNSRQLYASSMALEMAKSVCQSAHQTEISQQLWGRLPWNVLQISMVPRNCMLMTLMIPWLIHLAPPWCQNSNLDLVLDRIHAKHMSSYQPHMHFVFSVN